MTQKKCSKEEKMPLPKKLSCDEVEQIVKRFIDGDTVKKLHEEFNVTRLTISRLLRGETYKDCTQELPFIDAKFFESVDRRMKENQRKSRGQGKKIGG